MGQTTSIQIPNYDRTKVQPGIVHFGPSHFARAHFFSIIDEYMGRTGDLAWGITAVAIRKPESPEKDSWPGYEKLNRQQGVYHLFEQGLAGDFNNVSRRIDAMLGIMNGVTDPESVYEQIADPRTRLITSTVTQEGYDVTTKPEDKRTLAYYIVRGLDLRRQRGLPGITVMSLDNLVDNGTRLADVVRDQASANPALQTWIAENVAFPSTMVDRITPSSLKPGEAARIAGTMGVEDAWPVRTEEFLQLMIAHQKGSSLPVELAFEKGLKTVRFTDIIHHYELAKLRMLNGTHLAIGVVGQLMGYENIAQALSNPAVEQFAQAFMGQAAQSLKPIEGMDFAEYQRSNFARFVRLDPPDQLSRLSRNASKDKLDPRALATARDLIAQGKDFRLMAFTAAAWVHFIKGYDVNGKAFDINDAHAIDRGWQNVARQQPAAYAMAYLSDIFGKSLSTDPKFVAKFKQYHHTISQMGIERAMKAVVAEGAQANVVDMRRQPMQQRAPRV